VQVYVLKITLAGTNPPIWRTVAVPGDCTLARLHTIIQIVMGWCECHMHQFVDAAENQYGVEDPNLDMAILDQKRYRLNDIADGKGARFTYEYDFGDGWEHEVQVLKVGAPEGDTRYPVCLDGRRACPPENSGGVHGFYDMLAAIDDPGHEMREEYRDWLNSDFDPGAFDVELVNRELGVLQPRRQK
jgi:hypothetical protein